jgi:sulfur carrier protein ThiS
MATRTIKVTIAMVGAEDRTFTFESPVEVQEVLETAGINPDNFLVKVNGRTASLDTEINASADILLTKRTQGA